MPLYVPPAPAGALRGVLAALGSPSAVREARIPALRSPQLPPTAELPLPVHVIDRAPAEEPPVPRLAAWRFVIRAGGLAVAAADAVPTPDGWAFSHFFEGPYAAATERALAQAETLTAPLQPRLLSVPGLYMLTLWLHADPAADPATGRPGADDLLVPLAPAPPGIAAYRPYPAAELLPALSDRLAAARTPLLSA